MFDSIWEDIKREFSYGNMVTRLVIINVVVFVSINLVRLLLFLASGGSVPEFYQDILHFFCMSSDWFHVLTHPWGIFTSMFLHEGLWHILWNMLFLYWFGRIVGDFIGNQRILPLYLLGGLVGSVFYFLSALFLPIGPFALGASGAVMAIVVAAGTIAPDYMMRLIFLGDVKLKYIVAVLVFLDLIGIANNTNTGGHFAHLGGAAFGAFFVTQLRRGNDLSLPVNNMIDSIKNFFKSEGRAKASKRSKPRMAYKNPQARKRTFARNRRANNVSDVMTKEQLLLATK
ncbi:MAG: rhomboid family intramembrane serine protease, partial [Bacteroidota bacterium]